MMKKLVAHFLTILLLLVYVSPTAAQTGSKSGDWNTLNSQLNNEVAVKAGNRKTVFGILTAASADEIKVRTSDNNNVSEVVFKREEVEKIWLAKLNESSRKTLLGAGIGAAVGAGIGLIALKGSDGEGGGFGAAVPFYAAIGAVVGGVAGFFVRQKNKKERLIYQK
jgi:hypothetical protein